MYTASVRPRVRGVDASFNHDSTTTYNPAMQKPKTKRKAPQANGLTHKISSRTADDASDARLANTLMWPTADSNFTTTIGPIRNPAK